MIDFDALKRKNDKFGKLSRAPIREGIIAFHHSDVVEPDVAKLDSELKLAYPNFVWESRFNVKLHGDLLQKEGNNTVHFKSEAGAAFPVGKMADRYAIQYLPAQFAVSMLAPYSHWADFKTNALEWWSKAPAKATSTQHFQSLRFLNVLNLDLSFEDYLAKNFLHKIAGLDFELLGYTRQLAQKIKGSDYSAYTNIVFQPTTVKPEPRGRLLLDISVSNESKNKENRSNSMEIVLDEMAIIKNSIFFQTLNRKAIKLCS